MNDQLTPIEEQPVSNITGKPKPWVAVVLALLMAGLGHLYLGLIGYAIGVFLISLLCVFLIITLILPGGVGIIGWVCFAIIIGWMIGQAMHAGIKAKRMTHRSMHVPWYILILIPFIWHVFGELIILRNIPYRAFKIPSVAMEPTLKIGDYFLADMKAYDDNSDITRGDVIIILYPVDRTTKYVKRCVALPGDTVQILDKVLYVNGIKEPDSGYFCHIDKETIQRGDGGNDTRDFFGPYIVPKGNYFVLGDNRDNSSDSRFWGPVPRDFILGKVLLIHWSSDRSRIGKKINPVTHSLLWSEPGRRGRLPRITRGV